LLLYIACLVYITVLSTGMDKIMESLFNIGIKLFYVGCTERTRVASIFLYYFICLRCVVSVSVDYRLCLVTVRVKVFTKWET
jgi:hypothetical protein